MAVVQETAKPSGRRALDEAEAGLREVLAAADAAPFLGHYCLPDGVGEALRSELDRRHESLTKRLRLLFYLWPALTVTWIAGTVARRYGSTAQMELYPHLEHLLGSRIDPIGRRRTAELFRQACRRLDLPLPESAEPVDTYVVQAGVPVAQIEVLARAFLTAERREGLPDSDDDTAVAVFTHATIAALDLGHPRLKRVLEHDQTGWYARLWVTLRERPEELPDEPFVGLLVEAARLEGAVRGSTFRRPVLVWRDNLLAIEVPEGNGLRWSFDFGQNSREVIGEALPLVLPLCEPWRNAVGWTLTKPGARTHETGVLVPPTDPSELLAFAASTGRLVGRTQFEPEESVRPFHLGRGDYEVAGSGRFVGPDGIEPVRMGALWATRVRVSDAPVDFARSSLRATFAPVRRPELELCGTILRDLFGSTIFAARNLQVKVRWPAGFGAVEDARDRSYEVIVDGGGLSIDRFALPEEVMDGIPVLNLGTLFERSSPALRRVVFKLVRSGERRPIARAAAFVWIGLERVDGSRFAGRPPFNLQPTACAHLALSKERLALRTDQRYARARMVVDDVDDHRRQHTFEFAYPGVIGSLRWFDAEGRQREQVLDDDANIALRPGDTRLLDVTSPDRRAMLRVGAQERHGIFEDRPHVTMPLAAVAGYCEGGADRLTLRGGDGTEILLARFTVPCEVVRWTQNYDRLRGERSLLLGFHEPLHQLRVRARDLWGGTKAEFILEADGLHRRAIANGMSLRLERELGESHHGVRLVIELDDWPAGLWLIDLDAQLGQGGRWQALVNLRGDVYAWLLSHRLDGFLAGDLGSVLGLADQLRIFARCHKELQRCFAPPSWQGGADQILQIWQLVGRCLASNQRLAECWPVLLLLAFVEPPLEASESWLPMVSFWEVMPEFMSLSGPCYAALAEAQREDALVLAVLAELATVGSVGRFLSRWRLSASFFTCFGNLAKVHSSSGEIECRRFDFKAYGERIRSDAGEVGGWSASHEALSPAHYAVASDRLVRRYRVLASGETNAQRIPGAARLTQDAARWLEREGRRHVSASIPELVIEGALLDLSLPAREDEDVLLLDAPKALTAIALVCRLESRGGGTLDKFLNDLSGHDRARATVLSDINFLTNMGRDLFAFWMLFWEVLLTTGYQCKT